MRIVFLGTPEFSVPILEMLSENYEVVLVVTKPDTYNKKKIVYSPVKMKALELGIEVFQPISIKENYKKITDLKADMMITAAYGQFIPEKVLNSFKFHLNVHGSLLPKRRGGAPIQRAIIEGDSETGITIMEMVKKMDAGRMYAKRSIPILDSDTNGTMFEKLSIIGRDLLKESLPDIISGKNQGIAQDETLVTVSPNLLKEEELIDFNKPSRTIFNQIRGLNPNPGAYFNYNGECFKVYGSIVSVDNSDFKPGTILSLKKEMKIKTLDGAILITLIKPAGKNIMDIKSFLNGQRFFKECDIINN